MSRKKTWALYVLLTGIVVCLLVFWQQFHELGGNEEEDYEIYKRHYAMITGSEDSDFWDRVYESAKEEGKVNGVYVERFGENLAVEYECQELLKLAISASVDGIIIPGDEEEETVALLNEAAEKGIPVVTVLQDSARSLRQCFVGNNYYNLGQEYAKQMLEILSEENTEGKDTSRILVLMDESRTDSSQNLILLGIRETLKEKLNGKLLVSVETSLIDNSRSFQTEESIRDIFLSQEELPDILVCLSAVHTRCAYQAAVDYNKVGTVQILGYYDSEAILDAVSKNILYSTITLDTVQMGRSCVQALEEYVKTGYTNGYRAVDTHLITAPDANRLLSGRTP
ncbi:MAG: substrate-binding domain-containing protein [Lachnospiraceae bacterium]|jgi:ribose transport system substrate-binding protein|nr:sugar ABC transporter substrate-binding protein [Lachnospiraceae bacterium]MDE7058619.1 substrate-binding domain-containing protein [Lachnospiraceae bacterium]